MFPSNRYWSTRWWTTWHEHLDRRGNDKVQDKHLWSAPFCLFLNGADHDHRLWDRSYSLTCPPTWRQWCDSLSLEEALCVLSSCQCQVISRSWQRILSLLPSFSFSHMQKIFLHCSAALCFVSTCAQRGQISTVLNAWTRRAIPEDIVPPQMVSGNVIWLDSTLHCQSLLGAFSSVNNIHPFLSSENIARRQFWGLESEEQGMMRRATPKTVSAGVKEDNTFWGS